MTKTLKICILTLVSSLLLSPFFTNCTGPQPFRALIHNGDSSCGEHCQTGSLSDTRDFPIIEPLDTRQYLESYLSLLQLSTADIGSDLSRAIAEKNRRSGLLPMDNDFKLVSSIVILSQSSLAGEICRIWVNKKLTDSNYFSGIDFADLLENTSSADWINGWKKMSSDFYGRDPFPEEIATIKTLVDESISDSKSSANKSEKISNLNAEISNLAVMLCTITLSAPEASGI